MERDNDFRILGWLEEEESSLHGGTAADEDGPDLQPEVFSDSDASSEHQEYNTDSEQSDEDELFASDDLPNQRAGQALHENEGPVYVTKDGFSRWHVHNPRSSNTRTPKENIVTRLPGVKRVAKNLNTIMECWSFYFSDNIIVDIVRYTNQQLLIMSRAYTRGERDVPQTDIFEIKAYLGILYLAGVKKANHLNIDELWASDGTCPEFFSAVMSKRRFQTLTQAIRFDDKHTRAARKLLDNLAPIRELFEDFVHKCEEAYTISEYATIDEMLEAFRGRCKFRVYIPNKPAKYGIKIYALVDARTFYTNKLEVYTGQQPEGPFFISNDATSVVKRLIVPIDRTGRNITMDNYFTSIPLANDLFVNHRLTVVGTIRKNKPQLPTELTFVKQRPVKSSMFAFGKQPNNCLAISYVPKKGKNVLLISSMHKDDVIDLDSGELFKPETITFYNMTKGGVDVVDRLKSEYNVSRISNRWPLTLFFSLLNIGAINSQILLRDNTQVTMTRRHYLTQLAKFLSLPHLERRSSIPNLSLELKQKIRRVGNLPPPTQPQRRQLDGKPRCAYCPLRKNRFTQHQCGTCESPICKEHTANTILTCTKCIEEAN